MIPKFDDNDYLPPGIHLATIDEVGHRFGKESEIRRAQIQSLGWLVECAKLAGVSRIIVNGSFFADVYEPNDVDCALLLPPDYPKDPAADKELQAGFPFVQALLLLQEEFDYYVSTIYATDRRGVSKGMVEIEL
ncbi:MAG: hypothetical protein EXS16_21630 [Gemmataceae bacterium]|nr:hypothetical protein [Gemmataceae bacterium]